MGYQDIDRCDRPPDASPHGFRASRLHPAIVYQTYHTPAFRYQGVEEERSHGKRDDCPTKRQFGLREFFSLLDERIKLSVYERMRLSAYPELRLQKRGRTCTLSSINLRAEPTAPYRFLMSLAILRNMSMLLSDVRRCPVASLVLKDGGVDDVDWDDPETVESRCTG